MSPGMLPSDEVRPTDIVPRDYQLDAIDAVRNEFRAGRKSTLVIAATGVGKSTIMGSIARLVAQKGGRSLMIAHRGELIDQAAETFSRLGMDVGVERASSYARSVGEPHAVIATVQTLQRARLDSWPKDYFKLIMTDEAHHAVAPTYQRIIDHFDALHLGVTATADRADGEMLGQVFESVAFEYSLWDAMTAPPPGPYLCRFKFVQCDVGVDLRRISTSGRDLNTADLEEAIRPHVEVLANAIRQEIGVRKTIVFTPDVGSAQAMASALTSIGVTCKWVADGCKDRAEIIRAFKQGEFQALANCMIATEGFDAPDIAAVALCRPTKSRCLYSQMCGRGSRLAPGKKDCLLIDFSWLTVKHDLVKPVELFDTMMTDAETMAIAADMAERRAKRRDRQREQGVDLMEAVEQARAEKERRTLLRIRAREREMRYRKVTYDPLAAMEAVGMIVRKEADKFIGTVTEGQKRFLLDLGVTDVDALSKRRATRLIECLAERRDKGLATLKQVNWMIAKGCDPKVARAMTVREASEFLDKVFGKTG